MDNSRRPPSFHARSIWPVRGRARSEFDLYSGTLIEELFALVERVEQDAASRAGTTFVPAAASNAVVARKERAGTELGGVRDRKAPAVVWSAPG